jgi:propanol-preferring alcohol dehydrogenase
VGELVPVGQKRSTEGDPSVARIYLSDIPTLSYARHMFQDGKLRGVTANTRRDGERATGAAVLII